MSKKTLFLLILVVAGLMAWVKYNEIRQGKSGHSISEKLLSFDLQKVNEALIRNKGKEFRFIQGAEGTWTCPTSNDYAAKASSINELILKLSDLESSQKLTSNKDNFAAFGLNPSESVVTLKDNEGKELCVLELGKLRESGRQTRRGESCRYVKPGTRDAVYLASADLELPEEPSDWLQKVILNLPAKDISSIRFLKTDPEVILLKKEKEEEGFELRDLKPGDTLKPWMLNQVSGAFEGLAFNDVMTSKAAEAMKLSFEDALEILAKDGLLYRLGLAQQEQKFFLKVSTEIKNPPAEADKVKNLKEKADKLNQNFSKWVYSLDSYETANLKKQYKDFIEEKKTEQPAASPVQAETAPSQEQNPENLPGIMQNPEDNQNPEK